MNKFLKLSFSFCACLSLIFSLNVIAQEIEEVVVTATKKEESIQDLAVSVEAFTADDINNNMVEDFSDLAEVVPGLIIDKNEYTLCYQDYDKTTPCKKTPEGDRYAEYMLVKLIVDHDISITQENKNSVTLTRMLRKCIDVSIDIFNKNIKYDNFSNKNFHDVPHIKFKGPF